MAETTSKEKAVQVKERTPLVPFTWTEEIEHLFDRAFRPFSLTPWRSFWRRPLVLEKMRWIPDIDVFEQNGNVVVRADLPGMKREDIEVAVEGDMLVIRGHRESEKEIKEEDYYCAERAAGEFSRAIRLPESVTAESIKASYKDGVLEITMPRPAAAESKKVQVQVK